MVWASISGTMGSAMRASGKTIRSRALGSTSGRMAGGIGGTGRRIAWMGWGSIRGAMDGCIWDSIGKIVRKGMVFIGMLKARFTRGIGRTEKETG